MSLKCFFRKLADFLKVKINQIVLIFAYFIGIGFTAIFAKIFGKNFYFKSKNNSNWNLDLKKKNLKEMF